MEDDTPRCANGYALQYHLAVMGSGLAEVCDGGCHAAFVVLGEGPDTFLPGDSLDVLITREGDWLDEQPEICYSKVVDGIFVEWTTDVPDHPGEYAVRLEHGSLITLEYFFSITEPAELVLPANLLQIKTEAFAETNVGYVICPDGLVEIGARAFANCTQLACIVIPASVSVIADDAFEGCSNFVIEGEQESVAESFAQQIGVVFQVIGQ